MAKKKAQAAIKASAVGASNRRAALRAQQAAAAQKARRNRVLIAIACLVALALVVGLVVWVYNRAGAGKPTETPTATAPTSAEASSPVATTPQIVPPDANSTDIAKAAWITVPSSSTKSDALIVDIHTDYQCPFCEVVETSYATVFEQLNEQGDIILRQHTRSFLDAANKGDNANSSSRAAIAAACVDVADNTKYAAYHNMLFAHQPQPEGAGYSDAQLRDEFTANVGLSGDALATFQSCYDGRATATWVANTEQNNLHAVENPTGSPKYLFGGNVAPCYTQDAQTGKMTQVDCTADGAFPMGIMGTPSLLVNGVSFGMSDLFKTGYSPVYTSAADLLAFLQQRAKS